MKSNQLTYNLSSIFFGTLIIIFFACEPAVLFEESVPPGVDLLTSIPEQFQGVYRCESDGSRMFSKERIVFRESYYQFVTTLDKIRETEDCSILGGGLYLPGKKECIPFEYLSEDTITAKVYDLDTLFSFSAHQEAKYYKGRLFLNLADDKNKWITFMISPNDDGSLLWELIDIPNKLKEVSAITKNFESKKNKNDKTIYIINPSKVEFDRIISKESNLMECDILTPIDFEYELPSNWQN